MKEIKLPCPYCNSGFYSRDRIMQHILHCKHCDNSKSKAEILFRYIDQSIIPDILSKYQNDGYSINELCKQLKLKRRVVELILISNNIKLRTLKESTNCKRCLDARKTFM